MKTKVCYVITKGNWGGAQKYVYSLATALPKDEYDVVVVLGEGKILEEKLSRVGIKVITLKSLKRDISILRELKIFGQILKIILKEKPKVLHLNSPKAAGIGSLAGRLLFVPKIVQTVHGFTFNEKRKEIENALIAFFTWITIILCHKTIVLGFKEERQAKAMPFIKKDKIVLIRNGVEKIDFKEKYTARKELLLKTGKNEIPNSIWFGTISELHKNKGLEYAIEALRKINKSFVFFIIGEGEERKNLENLIKKYHLEEKVILLGFLEKAGEYLKAFDIFTLTSIKEGLPYAILEAGLAGLPVIASSIGGIPDIIENSVSGILTTKARPGEVTRAIEYLINNPDKAKLFGENLKAKIEKEFSFEQMLEKTMQLYKF